VYVIIAFHLLTFHGPNDQEIDIDPHKVVTVRPLRSTEHFGYGIKCLIHTDDGKYVAVTEECDVVKKAVEDARNLENVEPD
jgi:hypothetical protein